MYKEISFKRITGKVGFRFDALAVKLMCDDYNLELDQLETIPKEEYIPAWCYGAHRSYNMHRYKRPKLNLRKVKKFIAVMRKEEWDELVKVMMMTQGEQGESKEKKK